MISESTYHTISLLNYENPNKRLGAVVNSSICMCVFRLIPFIVTAQLTTEVVIVHPVKGDFQNELKNGVKELGCIFDQIV